MAENSLSDAFRRIGQNVAPKRKKQFAIVLVLTVLGSAAELATFGAIIPFLAIISDPDGKGAQAFYSALSWLGIDRPDDPIYYAAAGLIVAAILAAIVRLMLIFASKKFIFGVGYDIGTRLYARALQRPYIYYAMHSSSEVLGGVNKIQVVLNNTVIPAITLITSGGMAIVILGGMIAVDPKAAIFAMVTFGVLYGIVSLFTRRRLFVNSKVIAEAHSERVKAVQEGLGGIRDIILDKSHGVFLRNFQGYDHKLRIAQASNALIGQAPRFAVEAFGVIVIALLALYMSQREGGIIAAVPVLGALAFGAQRLMPLVQQVYQSYTQMTGASQAMFDIIELLEGPAPLDMLVHTTRKVDPLPFERAIEFSNVGYRYPGTEFDALSGIELEIPKGARIGFIGKTGSGKSTLTDILMGLLEPVAGEVRVDGTALTDETRTAWQAQVAHVPQSIFLSDDSIANNIAFGEAVEDVDLERVMDAARKADIHDYIAALPDGYATMSGERGVRLSGGQRQRIGIARALYKRATVLVLDEATSALDDETELAVMEAIDGLSHDLTILMIAHRLSTVRGCDRIVRLEKGRIASQGTFEQVVEQVA